MIETNKTRLETIQNSAIVDRMIESHKKIGHLEIDHEKVWIKRSEQTHSNALHRLIYAITRLKVLMPVENKSASQSLQFEAQKLQFLASKGIPVPEVVGYDHQFLYLADSGVDVRHYIEHDISSEAEKEKVILGALKVLCSIHDAGSYHAGAQIKNYTIANGVISAIDFEDSFSDKYRLEDVQFRDFFLFLFSLAPLNSNQIYQEVIDYYLAQTGNKDVKVRLKNIAKKTTPLLKLLKGVDMLSTRGVHMGQDVMSVCALLSFIISM